MQTALKKFTLNLKKTRAKKGIKKIFKNISQSASTMLTEQAIINSQNNAGIHGPFDTFADMMADINAEA